MNITKLATDYLVIGAGAASLAFVDTLLSEQPSAKVVIVDKHSAPGGHWNDAYGFVHLHQPSLLYGVSSKNLEGNWLKLMMTKQTLPWNHRASKTELLTYYQSLVNAWVKQGSVQYFPNCVYDFTTNYSDEDAGADADDTHKFDTLDGSQSYHVHVGVKLVNGILGECKVPSQCPVSFPVDKDINIITPNELYDQHAKNLATKKNDNNNNNNKFWSSLVGRRNDQVKNTSQPQHQRYVVLGCGKTGMDAVLFLQQTVGVPPEDISWVVPRDVWMIRRGGGSPHDWAKTLASHELDFDEAALHLEQRGALVRLDPAVLPTRFRFPVVGLDELEGLRRVQNIVRRGRVTSIAKKTTTSNNDSNHVIRVEFGPEQEPWDIESEAICFIHCTSPGPFNGNSDSPRQLFVSEKVMNLSLLFAPPVPISMSCLAMLESSRAKGTLDLDFGRQLVATLQQQQDQNNDHDKNSRNLMTGEDILKLLFSAAYDIGAEDPRGHIKPLVLSALFLALVSKDPVASHRWLARNRLSFLSVPSFQSGVHEDMVYLSNSYDDLGYTKEDAKMFALLANKLKPLEGK